MNEHLDLNRRPGEREKAGTLDPGAMGTGPYGKENAGIPGSSNTGPFPAGQGVVAETSDIFVHEKAAERPAAE